MACRLLLVFVFRLVLGSLMVRCWMPRLGPCLSFHVVLPSLGAPGLMLGLQLLVSAHPWGDVLCAVFPVCKLLLSIDMYHLTRAIQNLCSDSAGILDTTKQLVQRLDTCNPPGPGCVRGRLL